MQDQTKPTAVVRPDVTIRPLEERDLEAADRIMRLAFGTFLGLPDPGSFMGDAGYVRTRWRSDPAAAFAARVGDRVVGSNFATNWGSVGFFGPLTIHPDLWDRGVGKRLMEPVMDCFARWGTSHAGLFTFAHSQKHVGLYQRFGFWPRFLTVILTKAVERPATPPEWTRFSDVPESEREATLDACRRLTDGIHEGLDPSREIEAVAAQELGETVLVWSGSELEGLAVCHCGPGTEAGSDACYVKLGAARAGPAAERRFVRLLEACEDMASRAGLSRLVAGVNTGRHEAYGILLERGFRALVQGLSMHRPNEAGTGRPGVYLVDDWR